MLFYNRRQVIRRDSTSHRGYDYRKVKRIHQHPKYRHNNHVSDVSLIKVTGRLSSTNKLSLTPTISLSIIIIRQFVFCAKRYSRYNNTRRFKRVYKIHHSNHY